MRFLMKVSMPVEPGNAGAANGFAAIQQILEQQKPEAVYFIAEGGTRTGILIVNLDKESDIPRFAEPWFLAFNASVELTPAMTPEDLAAAASDLEAAVKSFG